MCVCLCVCVDTGSYPGCFLGKGMELRLKGQMHEVAKQLENLLSWRLEGPERRPGPLGEQEATRRQEGREQLWAEAFSPPGLPGSRRHQQSWVEPLPRPPSQAYARLSLASSSLQEKPRFFGGSTTPSVVWSPPCSSHFSAGSIHLLCTLVSFLVPPATLPPHSELCPPPAI